MLKINLGTAITKFMTFHTFTQTAQDYIEGVLEERVFPSVEIMSLINPLDFTGEQYFEPNAARVQGQIEIFTKADLNLNRHLNMATIVKYEDKEYFITSKGDWNKYGFFEYKGELIIPEATG